MPKRYVPLIRILCFALAAVVFYELVQAGFHLNPLGRVTIPAQPSLREEPEAKARETNALAGANGTLNRTNGTNLLSGMNSVATTGSNATPVKLTAGTEAMTNGALPGTNLVKESMTNALPTAVGGANLVLPEGPIASGSNRTVAGRSNVTLVTPSGERGTNMVSGAEMTATNRPGARASGERAGSAASARDAALAQASAGSVPGAGRGAPPPLAPAIQASVDRIIESELLGQVTRPLPMALMGIAGEFAILRAPSGQTGLVKEGGELGGLKLLKIGINRVLVEDQGQKKELTIFSGYGGESLVPKTEASH